GSRRERWVPEGVEGAGRHYAVGTWLHVAGADGGEGVGNGRLAPGGGRQRTTGPVVSRQSPVARRPSPVSQPSSLGSFAPECSAFAQRLGGSPRSPGRDPRLAPAGAHEPRQGDASPACVHHRRAL